MLTEEEQIAQAIALSLGEPPPPSAASRQPLFIDDDDDDDEPIVAAHVPAPDLGRRRLELDDEEEEDEGPDLPDFANEEEVDAYFARQAMEAVRAEQATRARELNRALNRREERRPVAEGSWGMPAGGRGPPPQAQEEPEMDAELQLALKLSREAEEREAAERRAIADEERLFKLAIEASLRPPSPPPRVAHRSLSADIDDDEYYEQLNQAVSESKRLEREREMKERARGGTRTAEELPRGSASDGAGEIVSSSLKPSAISVCSASSSTSSAAAAAAARQLQPRAPPLFSSASVLPIPSTSRSSSSATPSDSLPLRSNSTYKSIPASISSSIPSPSAPAQPAPPSSTIPSSSSSISTISSSALPSRAQMEAERLARMQKRALSTSTDDAPAPPSKRPRTTPAAGGGKNMMTFGELRGGAGDDNDDDGQPRTKPSSNAGAGSGSQAGGEVGGSTAGPRSRAGRGGDGSSGNGPGSRSDGNGSTRSHGGSARGNEGDRFWDGEMRMTNNHLTTTGPGEKTMTLRDIVGPPSDVKLAIISSYCQTADAVAHFPDGRTILVTSPNSTEDIGQTVFGRHGDIWTCFPYFSSVRNGVFHMKFTLLLYGDGRLRVTVASANLFDHDWEVIENAIWIQDFRPIPAGSSPSENPLAVDFGTQWKTILKACGIKKALELSAPLFPGDSHPLPTIASMDRYDFSRVTISLVASTHGWKTGWRELESYGVGRIGRVVRDRGWVASRSGKELKSLECQGSSLGKYTSEWMTAFWRTASGIDPRSWLVPSWKNPSWPPVKIVFPSLKTVNESRLGKPGGGTMFCTKNSWREDTAHLFHDSKSKRGPTILHLKMILAVFESPPVTLGGSFSSSSASTNQSRPTSRLVTDNAKAKAKPPAIDIDSGSETEYDSDDLELYSQQATKKKSEAAAATKGKEKEVAAAAKEDEGGKEDVGGWIYMGSHNFTAAAWGTFSCAKKDQVPKLDVKNYELGVLMPLPKDNANSAASRYAGWVRPPRPLTPKEEPWMQFIHNPREE